MKYYIYVGNRTTGGSGEGNVSTTILGRPVSTVGMKAICCNCPKAIQQGWTRHRQYVQNKEYDSELLRK